MFMEPKRKPGMSGFQKFMVEVKWLAWWLIWLAVGIFVWGFLLNGFMGPIR